MGEDKLYTNKDLARDYLIAVGTHGFFPKTARTIRNAPSNVHEFYRQNGTLQGHSAIRDKKSIGVLELLLSGQKTAEQLRHERFDREDAELRKYSHGKS